MKRFLIAMFLIMAIGLSGCVTFEKRVSPVKDYMKAASESRLNVDLDSNDALDVSYGGTNLTAIPTLLSLEGLTIANGSVIYGTAADSLAVLAHDSGK